MWRDPANAEFGDYALSGDVRHLDHEVDCSAIDLAASNLDMRMLKRGNTRKWTVIAAGLEAAATGLVLFVRPSLFAWLVFDAQFSDAGQALGRLTAIALLGLVLATWPSPDSATSPVRALLVYNLLATIYLLYVGIGGHLTGILLWPAIALHLIFSILLGRASLTTSEQTKSDTTGAS